MDGPGEREVGPRGGPLPLGWGLFVLPDGRLELVTFNAGSSVTATTRVLFIATSATTWISIAGA